MGAIYWGRFSGGDLVGAILYVDIEHKNTKIKNLLTSRHNSSCGQTSCVFGTTNRASH